MRSYSTKNRIHSDPFMRVYRHLEHSITDNIHCLHFDFVMKCLIIDDFISTFTECWTVIHGNVMHWVVMGIIRWAANEFQSKHQIEKKNSNTILCIESINVCEHTKTNGILCCVWLRYVVFFLHHTKSLVLSFLLVVFCVCNSTMLSDNWRANRKVITLGW